MISPLTKRLPKLLKDGWAKYIVVFLVMVLLIGITSGMLVANKSMIHALETSVDDLNREDGHLELSYQASDDLIEEMEKCGIKLFYQPYMEFEEDNDLDGEADGEVRVYIVADSDKIASGEEVNGADVLKGELPDSEGEIAIDRMHADNAGIKVGDKIALGGDEYTVTGLIARVDYSTLHKKSTDFMFDALTFNVAVVTEEQFNAIDKKVFYQYAWKYNEEPDGENAERKISEELMADLYAVISSHDNQLLDFSPAYANGAMQFAYEDLTGDMTMTTVIMIIFEVVLAFIMAITTLNTITRESAVIGTLRASGYTRSELAVHYISVPVAVTLLAAVFGNILGYTFFKDVIADLYYNSYSLPTYKTIWNPSAFIQSTLIPFVIMFAINVIIVSRKLRLSPLKFLRHDLSTSKRKKARRLPRWSFLNRFRLRIIMSNALDFVVMFCGLFLCMFLMFFTFALPGTIDHYKDTVVDEMFADYQYLIKSPVDEDGQIIGTSAAGAERYAACNLKTDMKYKKGESITAYGYEEGSTHIDLPYDLGPGEVYVSSAFAGKFSLRKGDTITLTGEFDDSEYEFTMAGTFEYSGSCSVFMPIDRFNEVFGYEEGYFNGFFTDEPIEDVSETYIMGSIDRDDLVSIANQLDHSMGAMMRYFSYACVAISLLLMFLITKIIIEKNGVSISLVKVLGYLPGEIASLYIMATSIVAILSMVISLFLSRGLASILFDIFLKEYDGYFPMYVHWSKYPIILLLNIVAYVLVATLDYIRIRKVPMTDALKNVE